MVSVWEHQLISVLCPPVWSVCALMRALLWASPQETSLACVWHALRGGQWINNCSELQLNELHRYLPKNQNQHIQRLSWPEPAQQCSSSSGGLSVYHQNTQACIYVTFSHYLWGRSNNTLSLPCTPGARCRASSGNLIFRQKLLSASIFCWTRSFYPFQQRRSKSDVG